MVSNPVRSAFARRRVGGFTLVELLAVIAIFAILVSLANPAFGPFIASQRTRAAATDLLLALTQARSEAIKRAAVVNIDPAPSGWPAGWQIVDSGGTVLARQGALRGVAINSASARITYSSSGRVRGLETPSFLVAAAGGSEQRCVSVDPSGRPYVSHSPC